MREVVPKLQNSLFFSLLAGNYDAETGSITTAVRHHALFRTARFSGNLQMARNWRASPLAFCLGGDQFRRLAQAFALILYTTILGLLSQRRTLKSKTVLRTAARTQFLLRP